MNDVSVSVPAEQYERLDALAAARGVSPEALLTRLIEDAYQGYDPNAPESIDLPLGVCADAVSNEDVDERAEDGATGGGGAEDGATGGGGTEGVGAGSDAAQ